MDLKPEPTVKPNTMNGPKNKMEQVMELMQQSPLPSKKVLEMLEIPKAASIAKLQAVARLSRHQAQSLWHLLKD